MIQSTIFNKHNYSKIEQKIESLLTQMWKFSHSIDELNNNRSSIKTNELHKQFAEVLLLCHGDLANNILDKFEFVVETTGTDSDEQKTKKVSSDELDLYGRYFNVDILIKNKITNKADTTILLKAPLTSMAKNRYNMTNNIFGEICRIMTPETIQSEHDILFINVIPTHTFLLNKKDNQVKKEESNYISLSSTIDGETTVLGQSAISSNIKDRINEILVPYNINLTLPEECNINQFKEKLANTNEFIHIESVFYKFLTHYTYHFMQKHQELIPEFKPIVAALNPIEKPKVQTMTRAKKQLKLF